MRDKAIQSADVIMVGFDVTRRDTFDEAASGLIGSVIPRIRKDAVVVAVGNKVDLVKERIVSTEEASSLFASMKHPIPYIETSAKTGENVQAAFELAVREWRAHCDKVNDNSSTEQRLKDEKQCIIA